MATIHIGDLCSHIQDFDTHCTSRDLSELQNTVKSPRNMVCFSIRSHGSFGLGSQMSRLRQVMRQMIICLGLCSVGHRIPVLCY